MPWYDVHHSTPLSTSQKESLAEKITNLHSRKFTTPSLFVNVVFTDASKDIVYVGGKPKTINVIFATVRPGGTRKVEDFEEMCEKVTAAWDEVVNEGKAKPQGGWGAKELRACFYLGSLMAAVEAGFRVPKASEDVGWLKNNVAGFKKLADEGDEDFIDLMKELETRDDLHAKL